LPFAALDLQQHCRPLPQGGATLIEIIVRVVSPLHSTELVPQAALGDFTSDAEGCQVRAHRAPQVMQGEMRNTVLDTGDSGVQRVDADVQRALTRIAAALREDVVAATCN